MDLKVEYVRQKLQYQYRMLNRIKIDNHLRYDLRNSSNLFMK